MESKEWSAWINRMPPNSNTLHVKGKVRVGSPSVKAQLTEKVPAGLNPNILILDLHLISSSGMSAQVMSWVECRFAEDLNLSKHSYSAIEIMHENSRVALIGIAVAV